MPTERRLAAIMFTDIVGSAVEEHDEAIALGKRAVDAAPLDGRIRAEYAGRFFGAGRFERARDELLRLIESDPDLPDAYGFLWLVSGQLGLDEEAEWAGIKFNQLLGRDTTWREEAFRGLSAELSTEERIRIVLPLLLEHREESLPTLVILYARIGENDLAFEWLERMYEERHSQLVFLRLPSYNLLRSDPRFQSLLRRIGFPEG